MGCSIRFYGNSYLAVINYGRIIFRGKSFCFQAYVWIGVSACVTTKTADRMAAICAFNCFLLPLQFRLRCSCQWFRQNRRR